MAAPQAGHAQNKPVGSPTGANAPAGQVAPGGAVSQAPAAAPKPEEALIQVVKGMVSGVSYEPEQLFSKAVTAIATTAAGGTEVKFAEDGIIVSGSGGIGVYWSRPVQSFWSALLSGRGFAYSPRVGFFVGTQTLGGINPDGICTFEFYRKYPGETWDQCHKRVMEWVQASGAENGLGTVTSALSGTDVTLGTFSDAGAGTQVFKAGTNMPVGGASKQCDVILNTPGSNTDAVWVGESLALAVASNNPIMPSGQDVWQIPSGGTLFVLANSGTQKVGARVRS